VTAPARRAFADGVRAMVPLWAGVIPFGAAYAVTARAAGLTIAETQLMSLIVFSGGAQFSAAGLVAAGAGPWTIVATTFLINVRHVLYGLALGGTTPLRGWRRLAAAHLLTDEAFGVHVAHGHGRAPFLLGAGLSLFVVWNAATLLGAVFAHRVPDPAAIGLDLVFPLAFLALLLPLLTGRVAVLVALVAGGLAWALAPVTGFGVAVLVAGVGGSTLGAALTRGTDPRAAVVSRAPKGRTR
jgi:4-azaleucine resistance transporter AzlC